MHRHEREAKDRRLVTHWNPENRGYSKGRNTSGEADTSSPGVEGSQSHSCVMEITCWIIICTLLSQPDDQQTAQWMIRVYTIISLSTLNCALIKYDLFSMWMDSYNRTRSVVENKDKMQSVRDLLLLVSPTAILLISTLPHTSIRNTVNPVCACKVSH